MGNLFSFEGRIDNGPFSKKAAYDSVEYAEFLNYYAVASNIVTISFYMKPYTLLGQKDKITKFRIYFCHK